MKVSLSQLMWSILICLATSWEEAMQGQPEHDASIKRGKAYSAIEEVPFWGTTWVWATILNLHVWNVLGTNKRKRRCICAEVSVSMYFKWCVGSVILWAFVYCIFIVVLCGLGKALWRDGHYSAWAMCMLRRAERGMFYSPIAQLGEEDYDSIFSGMAEGHWVVW